jgi:hypothetical protein
MSDERCLDVFFGPLIVGSPYRRFQVLFEIGVKVFLAEAVRRAFGSIHSLRSMSVTVRLLETDCVFPADKVPRPGPAVRLLAADHVPGATFRPAD